jgi:ATP-dependent protease ClpP protease subunit
VKQVIRGAMIGALVGLLLSLAVKASAQEAGESIQLGTANTVTLRGPIDDDSAQQAALALIKLDIERGKKYYPLYLVLDTPGGSIDSGEMFIEITKSIKNLKTITVFAASMGSAIVEALPGERLIISSGILMFHRAAGQIQGQFETGEMESRLEMYKQYVRRMEQRNADRMKMPLSVYKKKVKDELWYTSSAAISEMAADRTVSLTCTPALINQTQVVNIQMFIFNIAIEFSGCPLLRAGVPAKETSEAALLVYEKYKAGELKSKIGGLK